MTMLSHFYYPTPGQRGEIDVFTRAFDGRYYDFPVFLPMPFDMARAYEYIARYIGSKHEKYCYIYDRTTCRWVDGRTFCYWYKNRCAEVDDDIFNNSNAPLWCERPIFA